MSHKYDQQYEALMRRLDGKRGDSGWLQGYAVHVRFWGLYGGFRRWGMKPEQAYATAYSVTSQQYFDHPDMAQFDRVQEPEGGW